MTKQWKAKLDRIDVVFDIETVIHPVTTEDIEIYMQNWKPAGNVTKPETILRHREEAQLTAAEDIAKSRSFSIGGKRMISAALGIVNHSSGEVENVESFASNELSVITEGVAEYLNPLSDYRLVGWNINNFDLPELIKSLYLTGVRLKKKPGKWDVIDMNVFPFRGLKLKDTAAAFGLTLSGVDGSQVADLYSNGEWDAIAKYNEEDVTITGKLFYAVNNLVSFG